MDFKKILDLLMFREGTNDENDLKEPVITTGSIVWGLLIRSAILIVLSFLLIDFFDRREYWWFSLFFIWFFAAYPAYRQYTFYNQKIEEFKESTLCGSCKHFDQTGRLCRLYDEHVSKDYIPCEGDSWEPNSFEIGQ